MDIREKLVELLREGIMHHYFLTCEAQADYLLANGVTVQEMAYWTDVMDCGVGNCFGHCSNCLTQQKAASYASLMAEYRHCRWCGARMVYQPPKGECAK